jgi:leader peptidase (prepilin peptidase) / N-methyltransferase
MIIVYTIIFFIIGAGTGNLLSRLIYRYYKGISLWKKSICPKCTKPLKFKDLIPIFSFAYLKAKCRICKKKIDWQYIILEIGTGLIFVLFFLKYQNFELFLFRDLFFVMVLLFILVFDLKYYLILDNIIVPIFFVSLIVNFFLGVSFLNMFWGGLIGGGFFLIQYLITRAKGIGSGDIALGLLIGVMLGWKFTIVTIFLAYLIGGLLSIFLLVSKKMKIGDVLPLGSFLAIGAIVSLLVGDVILNFLTNL